MPFSDIVGQDRAVELLRRALAEERLHHGYLFGGPSGVGKELVARTLAQAANCERADGDACGVCGPCRRVAGRNHPDILWVLPEAEQVARGWAGRSDFEGTPSREIRIGQVRALQERLSLKALEARRKFVLILSAEAMNPQAQNALLKTLEEPPEATTLVLVTSAPNALLPTIRSRCMALSFSPLPLEFVAGRVAAEARLALEAARLCAALGDGSLSAALALAGDAEALERRQQIIAGVEALSTRARPALALAAELAEERSRAEVALELLGSWYRDVAAVACGAEPHIHRDLTGLLQGSARRLGAAEALRRHDLCRTARFALRGPASVRLQLEQLFLRFAFPDA